MALARATIGRSERHSAASSQCPASASRSSIFSSGSTQGNALAVALGAHSCSPRSKPPSACACSRLGANASSPASSAKPIAGNSTPPSDSRPA
jgi:hypothetical protein